MTTLKPEMQLEDVLLAFSVEPVHDKPTLDRYLALYPQYTEDLIDLSLDLRIEGRGISEAFEDEATFQRALEQLRRAGASPRSAANPFEAFRGTSFASLADSLRVPRSVLIAFRDRLVIVSSVPQLFLARIARAAHTTVADLLAYLNLPPAVAGAMNYKADVKPASSEKVPFEALLDSSGVTPEQKADIYTSSD
ncbi:hypothetical protein [Bradyrhizobium japonicum]|uniref:hypothetical protein n=1 Tax=Bradyrhizobium japonicum TaxID=375 RepID=UPI00200F688B|nr:hypothetical protein [Bradyrhizobium japonicum]UQE03545.1 hypothetical protein JEY30_47230 [Bradyrhizobium japonicum]